MKFFRRSCLVVVSACLCALWTPLGAQTPAPQAPAPAQPQQAPRPPSPFENVPAAPLPGAPQEAQPPAGQPPAGQPPAAQPAPRMEAPQAAPQAAQPTLPASGEAIEAVEFRGARRVPQDTLKALIFTKAGDIYNEETLRRDFMSLWNTGRFDDIRLETEPGRLGLVIRFVVTERRVIRSINYEGIHTVSVSEILDRFKERKVGLTVESQYDPNKIQRAAVVLKEFESERGRQYATVDPVIEQVPPSSLKLTFNVNEGPKVKVGKIEITGNKAYDNRWVVAHMKQLKPFGVPHSILFENLFAKTFDSDKLEYDKEMIRQAYQDHGYFTAKALDDTVVIERRGGRGWRLPLIKMNNQEIVANITIPVEEGRLYHLHAMNFVGVKLFRTPEVLMKPFFGMSPGDVFSTDKLKKGLETMRKYYGQFGYIDFVPEPSFDLIPNTDQIDVTLTADEGKQFFIRRIDFSGNSTTRDKVIRREILLDEGDIFNSQLWDLSILRLNQLGYFEMLKKEDAADIKRNPQSNTVDITLKVKERGKNSIGLNGGVSGIAGSFVGFNYSTNNFLGLGETLSLESQLGTRMRNVSLGFTEPYFLDRPLQVGWHGIPAPVQFQPGARGFDSGGQNLIPLYNQLGPQNLLNYIQNSHGFNVSAELSVAAELFARRRSPTATTSPTSRRRPPPAQPTSPTSISTVCRGPIARRDPHQHDHAVVPVQHGEPPDQPDRRPEPVLLAGFAGSVLGGNVNTHRARRSTPSTFTRAAAPESRPGVSSAGPSSRVTGARVPPFSRTFIGGEQDIRGFEIWGITPIAFIPTSATINVLNADGTARTQKVVSRDAITSRR